MTYREFIDSAVVRLAPLYGADEARAAASALLCRFLDLKPYKVIAEPATPVGSGAEALEEALGQLAEGRPLQYVLGYTEFCGRRFAVDDRALIPRAETEVLCQEAEKLVGSEPLRVLDLCTGSGCIAWTLALDLPGSGVVATDLSQDALDLADSQFRTASGRPSRLPKGAIRPQFVKADLLDVEATVAAVGCGFNLLTANPPYVMVAEKADMRQNVLGWEPHMAIFAPEEDPLVFHKAIAEVALRVLASGGCGIVEINSEIPDETAAVFTAAGFKEINIIPDYFDRPRFVSFRRP